MQVWSLALLTRIWHCRELWCRLLMQFGSHVALAVVQANSYSFDSTPSLGTYTCCSCSPKKKKEKKNKIEDPERLMFYFQVWGPSAGESSLTQWRVSPFVLFRSSTSCMRLTHYGGQFALFKVNLIPKNTFMETLKKMINQLSGHCSPGKSTHKINYYSF